MEEILEVFPFGPETAIEEEDCNDDKCCRSTDSD